MPHPYAFILAKARENHEPKPAAHHGPKWPTRAFNPDRIRVQIPSLNGTSRQVPVFTLTESTPNLAPCCSRLQRPLDC